MKLIYLLGGHEDSLQFLLRFQFWFHTNLPTKIENSMLHFKSYFTKRNFLVGSLHIPYKVQSNSFQYNSVYFFSDRLLRLTTVDGKTVFMFRGYTFSFLRPSIRILRCSRMFRGKCEVRLRILPNTLDVIQISHEHNHPPPNGIITPGGLYLRK